MADVEFLKWVKPKIKKHDVILDLGFGENELAELRKFSDKIIGITDFLVHPRKEVRKGDGIVSFIGDYNELIKSIPPESIDVIFMSASLYGADKNFFKQAHRVLKPKGKMLLDEKLGSSPKQTPKSLSKFFKIVDYKYIFDTFMRRSYWRFTELQKI